MTAIRCLHVFVLTIGLLLSASRALANASDLVGSWEIRHEGNVLRFTFDGQGAGDINGMPFQWVWRDGSLELTMEDNTVAYNATISEGKLHLSGGDLMAEAVLSRSAGKGGGPDQRIQGKWRTATGTLIEFAADGSGRNQRGEFKYTASEGTLIFNDATAGILFHYAIDGDRLTIGTGGEEAVFTRAESDAVIGTPPARNGEPDVWVNRVKLSQEQIRKLETQFRIRAIDGKYWYDAKCGAWGLDGGPCLGFFPPRLQLGGPLPADASGRGSGVFINGRELHPVDVAGLQRITGVVIPGRYWVDESGNCGYEGNPTPVLNLVQLASAAASRSGGSYHSRNDFTGIGSGGDGKTSYVMGKDWSVIIGE